MTTIEESIKSLDEAVRRADAEKRAAFYVSVCKIELMKKHDRRHVFFVSLAMKLGQPVISWNVPTAATDGRRLYVNPDWFNSLTREEQFGVMIHEILHCTNNHITRIGGRERGRWNIACDLAINHIIEEAGWKLPQSGCFAGRGRFSDMPLGLSAEQYYSLLPDDAGEGMGDDPGGCGGIMSSADPAEQASIEADWKVDVCSAAAMAKKARGDMPAALERLIDDIMEPAVDWRTVLRSFVTPTGRDDYGYFPPNRRFVHMGLYLPSVRSDELGRVVVAVDTSGSIDHATLKAFAAELQAILESYKVHVEIVYCDAAVNKVDHWSSDDGPLVLRGVGGGGTDHRPVFDHVDKGDIPTCLVCLTDGYTMYPDSPPDYPVLWAMTTDQKPPFGQVVRIPDGVGS